MIAAVEILRASSVRFEPYKTWSGVFLTRGNQLIGSFKALKRFQELNRDYAHWQAHHILESVDLERLGVANKFPSREEQICVLIPERAHIGRINSILRHENPLRLSANAKELRVAYSRAYELVGNYCGGGETLIQLELVAIVDAILRFSALPARR